jgi:hypothetical protein
MEGTKKEAAKPKAEETKHWAHQFGDLEDRKACQHEMCLPPDYTEPVKDLALDDEVKEPVRKYPFTLDPFQKVALPAYYFMSSFFFFFFFIPFFALLKIRFLWPSSSKDTLCL